MTLKVCGRQFDLRLALLTGPCLALGAQADDDVAIDDEGAMVSVAGHGKPLDIGCHEGGAVCVEKERFFCTCRILAKHTDRLFLCFSEFSIEYVTCLQCKQRSA